MVYVNELETLTEGQTQVSKAMDAVAQSELAIARALHEVSGAVMAGEVEACVCLYTPLVCAQDDMERTRKALQGHGGDREKMVEAIMKLVRP